MIARGMKEGPELHLPSRSRHVCLHSKTLADYETRSRARQRVHAYTRRAGNARRARQLPNLSGPTSIPRRHWPHECRYFGAFQPLATGGATMNAKLDRRVVLKGLGAGGATAVFG